jgi:hypothetical protein
MHSISKPICSPSTSAGRQSMVIVSSGRRGPPPEKVAYLTIAAADPDGRSEPADR